ncbi:MAG: patatin-like phospholipase family protein [Proteobacteria bacterium]|nr:patatin-like phospholipase family protein [Pseudomonadota bacterium]
MKESQHHQIKHLTYVASISQSDAVRRAISRIKGQPLDEKNAIGQGWEITHPLLQGTTLKIHLLTTLQAITPHLRQNPVDLLIYDERGDDAIEANAALTQIRKDVKSFAELWGPDFLFPLSRVAIILDAKKARENHQTQAARAFELGRFNVRDVCIAPDRTVIVLKWLHQLLTADTGKQKRIGVAMSGGGLEGFLYQLGVTYALERSLSGKSLRDADVFSGVSSGSIASTLLATNVPIIELIKAMHGRSEMIQPFTSSTIFDIASSNIFSRVIRESITWKGLDPIKWIKQILKAIPTGFFKGENLRAYARHCIEVSGGQDSFESLKKELYIGGTDMDSFEHVVFGQAPWDKIPLSEAIYASCALPLVFVPNELNGRWFIDGQITKTCNLELVVERGCDLIFIIDPVKPLGSLIPGSVDKKGGYYALIQTIKALVYTRFHSVLSHLTERYPTTDFMVFQPDEDVAQMMAGSPMRYRIRTQVIAMAYQQTMRQLRERHKVYRAKLKNYDMNLLSIEDLKEVESKDATFFAELAQGSV